MEINLIKHKGSVMACTDDDIDKLKKLKEGEVYSFEVKRFRNYAFHKKFFAMLNLAYENQDRYKDFEHFRKVMTMKAGYFDEVATDKGVVFLPKSISFDKMDNFEFENCYEKVLTAVMDEVGLDKQDILAELAAFG